MCHHSRIGTGIDSILLVPILEPSKHMGLHGGLCSADLEARSGVVKRSGNTCYVY
jgi:hypothetical protein